MTALADINISYEDALRLSELMGARDRLMYMQTDLVGTNLGWYALGLMFAIIAAVIVSLCLMLAVGSYLDGWAHNGMDREAVRRRNDLQYWFTMAVAVASFVAVFAVVMYAVSIGIEASVNADLVDVNGQIESILERYDVGYQHII